MIMPAHKNTFRHVSDTLRTTILINLGGQTVIERIVSAYGFASRQAFCNHLGISQSTMAYRYARDTFPAGWLLVCNLETGASVEWLSSGEDAAKTNEPPNEEFLLIMQQHLQSGDTTLDQPIRQFPIEIEIINNEGGKAAIDRLVNAYGFPTRQALADHLRISKSTLANRYLRDTFPSDWIIQCALETGAYLLWLTSGKGSIFSYVSHSVSFIKKQKLTTGLLQEEGHIAIDKSLLVKKIKDPIAISVDNIIYISDTTFDEISDGDWLVEIEGKLHIKTHTHTNWKSYCKWFRLNI
ncbi:phage repressor protein CI [Enterobacter roggenkampii]|nr:phage repressor protein CI [Enterobacter roggenkampii]MDL0006134.1 helix-turn-helix domain-containing protein [Enterobacter roggenkampii]MED5758164.1 phage repressor protein CI [Enterobacter roggenkampii]